MAFLQLQVVGTNSCLRIAEAGFSEAGINGVASGGTQLPVAARPFMLAGSAGLAIGANDGLVDDFLALVDGWEAIAGHPLVPPEATPVSNHGHGSSADNMIEHLAGDCSPQQMRQLGASLLKLADSLDQMWCTDKVKSRYGWLSTAGRIERRALTLAQTAIRLQRRSKARGKHLRAEFFGEPSWEILLELFVQFAGGARVATKSLCIVSGVSDTTALRLIDRLEDAGLVERSVSPADKRVTLVGMTRKGVVAVGSILLEQED